MNCNFYPEDSKAELLMYVSSQKLDNDIKDFYANEDDTPSLSVEIKKASAYNGTSFGFKLKSKIKDHFMKSDLNIYEANLTLEESGILYKTDFFQIDISQFISNENKSPDFTVYYLICDMNGNIH